MYLVCAVRDKLFLIGPSEWDHPFSQFYLKKEACAMSKMWIFKPQVVGNVKKFTHTARHPPLSKLY